LANICFTMDSMNTQIDKQKVGRPSVLNEDTVRKLESCIASGLGVSASCYLAKISRTAFYENKAIDMEFANRIRFAEEFSTLAARNVILNEIKKGNVRCAMWWLERKARVEFAPPHSM
jgi:hypothetical protein